MLLNFKRSCYVILLNATSANSSHHLFFFFWKGGGVAGSCLSCLMVQSVAVLFCFPSSLMHMFQFVHFAVCACQCDPFIFVGTARDLIPFISCNPITPELETVSPVKPFHPAQSPYQRKSHSSKPVLPCPILVSHASVLCCDPILGKCSLGQLEKWRMGRKYLAFYIVTNPWIYTPLTVPGNIWILGCSVTLNVLWVFGSTSHEGAHSSKVLPFIFFTLDWIIHFIKCKS